MNKETKKQRNKETKKEREKERKKDDDNDNNNNNDDNGQTEPLIDMRKTFVYDSYSDLIKC